MSNEVTGKIEFSREDIKDIDWRVEQKLSRLLAERDLYYDGLWQGFWIAVFAMVLLYTYMPELKAWLTTKAR